MFDQQHGAGLWVRRQVLQGTWMLAEADGVTPEEERFFDHLASRLDLAHEVFTLKKESCDLQARVNDLATAMFRTCQQVLAPTLGQPEANDFLEGLAQIAATPAARRSLRNSLRSGFSTGGVVRSLDEHGERSKLIAQACNAVCAVYGGGAAKRKAGKARLLELAESSTLGRGAARAICADIEALFQSALDSSRRAQDEGLLS